MDGNEHRRPGEFSKGEKIEGDQREEGGGCASPEPQVPEEVSMLWKNPYFIFSAMETFSRPVTNPP